MTFSLPFFIHSIVGRIIWNYFNYPDKSYDNWSVFTKNDLNKDFIYIEFYKTQNGVYPDSLNYLKQYDSFLKFTDTPKGNKFYYEKISDTTYYFFGVGKDQKPFTKDDFYPELTLDSLKQNGLIKFKNETK